MGFIANKYRKQLLCRYDKDGYTPYLSASDFPGLTVDAGSFVNSAGVEVAFFRYRYGDYDPEKLVVFCHGLGAGHTAYLAEIEYLCHNGLQVLTLDYTGCDKSGGDGMLSVNRPSRDVLELLDFMKPTEEVSVVGHSLGGYTALNVIRMCDPIKRAVILSGFLQSRKMLGQFIKSRLVNAIVDRAERKCDPEIARADNAAYLKSTTDRLLFIASTDDPTVPYSIGAGLAQTLGNDNLSFLTVENKKHNPNYTPEALAFMQESFGTFNRLVAEGKLQTLEEKRAFFSDRPASKMTVQDDAVMGEVVRFIKG
ncbi:MAG: alpha/beta hydrolase [Clostridia bacterium]|nr:alpha/beta hydrolase [Clostridia bacterium]